MCLKSVCVKSVCLECVCVACVCVECVCEECAFEECVCSLLSSQVHDCIFMYATVKTSRYLTMKSVVKGAKRSVITLYDSYRIIHIIHTYNAYNTYTFESTSLYGYRIFFPKRDFCHVILPEPLLIF